MSMPQILIWRCPKTPPPSTTARMILPLRQQLPGKPPSAGATTTQSRGLPKFEKPDRSRALWIATDRTPTRIAMSRHPTHLKGTAMARSKPKRLPFFSPYFSDAWPVHVAEWLPQRAVEPLAQRVFSPDLHRPSSTRSFWRAPVLAPSPRRAMFRRARQSSLLVPSASIALKAIQHITLRVAQASLPLSRPQGAKMSCRDNVSSTPGSHLCRRENPPSRRNGSVVPQGQARAAGPVYRYRSL